MRPESLITAIGLAAVLLIVEHESVHAGFLSASPVSWLASDLPVSQGVWLDDDSGSSGASEESADPLPVELNDALSATLGIFRPGGMSSSVPDSSGSSVALVAIILVTHPTDLPIVTWVRTEARTSLPRRAGSDILRPPRGVAVV